MGLVLWIDQNTFATGLYEKVFKKKGLPFYTVSSAQDFAYLIKDLSPEVVVVEARTALSSLDAFKRQYEETGGLHGLPVLIVDELPGLEFIANRKGELKRPFDPFMLPEKIKQALEGA